MKLKKGFYKDYELELRKEKEEERPTIKSQ